jgi:type II secretory ATPase GspE/PulE/Tfp pilus assembly ATPase PilB-like protein
VRYRIDGVLVPGPMIPRDMTGPVVARIKIISDLDISERRLPQDGRASLAVDGIHYDLRVSVLPTVKGETVVMRVLDST